MDAWDVFDAETPDLQAELRRLNGALRGAAPEEAARMCKIQELILQELSERDCSEALFSDIQTTLMPVPEPPPPVPPPERPTAEPAAGPPAPASPARPAPAASARPEVPLTLVDADADGADEGDGDLAAEPSTASTAPPEPLPPAAMAKSVREAAEEAFARERQQQMSALRFLRDTREVKENRDRVQRLLAARAMAAPAPAAAAHPHAPGAAWGAHAAAAPAAAAGSLPGLAARLKPSAVAANGGTTAFTGPTSPVGSFVAALASGRAVDVAEPAPSARAEAAEAATALAKAAVPVLPASADVRMPDSGGIGAAPSSDETEGRVVRRALEFARPVEADALPGTGPSSDGPADAEGSGRFDAAQPRPGSVDSRPEAAEARAASIDPSADAPPGSSASAEPAEDSLSPRVGRPPPRDDAATENVRFADAGGRAGAAETASTEHQAGSDDGDFPSSLPPPAEEEPACDRPASARRPSVSGSDLDVDESDEEEDGASARSDADDVRSEASSADTYNDDRAQTPLESSLKVVPPRGPATAATPAAARLGAAFTGDDEPDVGPAPGAGLTVAPPPSDAWTLSELNNDDDGLCGWERSPLSTPLAGARRPAPVQAAAFEAALRSAAAARAEVEGEFGTQAERAAAAAAAPAPAAAPADAGRPPAGAKSKASPFRPVSERGGRAPPAPLTGYSRYYGAIEEIFTAYSRPPQADASSGAGVAAGGSGLPPSGALRSGSAGSRRKDPTDVAAHIREMARLIEVSITAPAAASLEAAFAVDAPQAGPGPPRLGGAGTPAATAFPTATSLGVVGDDGSAGRLLRYFRVTGKENHPEVYALLASVLRALGGWAEDATEGALSGPSWNLLWTWSSKLSVPADDLLTWQRVNHFPEAKHLTRKDLLKRQLQRYAMVNGRAFDVMPTTFVLPKEYVSFCEAFGQAREELAEAGQPPEANLWIMKPVGLSRGRGIFVVNDIAAVQYGDAFVVQRYVADPLLLEGRKFDLRLYVLVTAFSPLEAFLYTEGFARLSSEQYSTEPEGLANKFIHLTNSSIQKMNPDLPSGSTNGAGGANANGGGSGGGYGPGGSSGGSSGVPTPKPPLPPFNLSVGMGLGGVNAVINGTSLGPNLAAGPTPHARGAATGPNPREGFLDGGSKWSLERSFGALAARGVDAGALWASVRELVVKSLVAVQDMVPAQPNAFELFGFDVLIDSNLRPWLIEVNASPSLEVSTPLDRSVKGRLLADIVRVVDPQPFDRTALRDVLTRRAGAAKRAGMGTMAEERERLQADLTSVLGGRAPRGHGELPPALGLFERVAPGRPLDSVMRQRRASLASRG